MNLVGRRRELDELDGLLDRADAGSGGVLVIIGAPGSGRTALVEVAVGRARGRGFEVVRATPVDGRSGRWVWAQLVRDVGAPGQVVARLLATPGPLDLDAAAVALCSGPRRLVVIDDVDVGGPDAAEVLAVLAGRVAARSVAVLVTSAAPLGVGQPVRLAPLGPAEIGAVTGEGRPEVCHALWAASRGLPGPAMALAAALGDATDGDPVVHLALAAVSSAGFLDVDVGMVRLLETALQRVVADESAKARLLARLAYALLGDATAAARRRALVDDALELARRSADPAVVAEVLDARLHALWDPAGARDRWEAAAEIVDLARESADLGRERRGLFWRFVALMELGRIAEAEAALSVFEGEARAAGDVEAMVMVLARHAMLATLRGRFADAEGLVERVAEQGERAGVVDTDRLVGTVRGAIALLRGDRPGAAAEADTVEQLRGFSRRIPGHFYEASTARFLLHLGQTAEAGLELQRALPGVLAGSGPRWVGAAADLAVVAAGAGDIDAATRLFSALAGYRGRLVVWAGANTATGSVAYFLGILAAALDHLDDAVELLTEATTWERQVGALPFLARTTAALADALALRGHDGDIDRAGEHRRQSRDLAQQLGMTGLLAALAPPPGEWALRRDGTDWLLEAGTERARLRDGRGLGYLRALLAAPGHEIPSLDLVAGGAGLAATAAPPLLDRTARDSYRRRLAALEDELDAADATGDAARAERADTERQALLDELRRATGLGARPRGISAEDERARVNVTRTLRATLERITDLAPHAGAHLAASIHTGRACRYQPSPDGPTRWQV